MSETPLQLALRWKKMFSGAKALIEKSEYKQAIVELNDALSVMEELEREGSTRKGGAHDLRTVETMERLAFAHHGLRLLTEAESIYTEALNLCKGRLLAMRTKEAILSNLHRLYVETGRTAEADKLKKEYPSYSSAFGEESNESNDSSIQTFELETSLMLSLQNVINSGDGQTRELMEIAEALAKHTESVFGTDSPRTTQALREIGKLFLRKDPSKAEENFTRALKISLAKEGDNSAEIADCMHSISLCDPKTALSKAFYAKARLIEKEIGKDNPMDAAMRTIFSLAGEPPPPDMVPEEVERILQNWRNSQESEVTFLAASVEGVDRYQRLLAIAEAALPFVEEAQARNPFPLSICGVLGIISDCHKELGNRESAREFKKREMNLMAKHWGEGHEMVVDALEQYEAI